MYFWRIDRLKTQLKQAPLTDRQVLPYFIVFLSLLTVVSATNPLEPNVWDYLTLGYAFCLSTFGTIYLYRKNGGSAGVHFLQRYMAVGWVVGVRWAAFVFPPFLFFSIAVGLPPERNVVQFGYLAVAGLVLYQRIGHHLADLASHPSAI